MILNEKSVKDQRLGDRVLLSVNQLPISYSHGVATNLSCILALMRESLDSPRLLGWRVAGFFALASTGNKLFPALRQCRMLPNQVSIA